MEKDKLAIIGASYLQLPLIEKAKEMGYETHVFAWAAGDVGEGAADFFHPISIADVETIVRRCSEIGVCGVCSIASDLATVAVNGVAEALGLVGNGPGCTRMCTNKAAMRAAFLEAGDPSPRSVPVGRGDDLGSLGLSFPVIVKPTDRSGSRGVSKLDGPSGLRGAVARAIDQSFEGRAVVEEFVEGDEYSAEFISYRGEHHFLALTEKFTTGAPHFIETGHLEPARVAPDLRDRIASVVEHALGTLRVENGASHSEVKVTADGEVKIVEVGARMGGDCIGSDLVHCSTGVDFVRCVVQVACGMEPDLTPDAEGFAVRSAFVLDGDDYDEYLRIKQDGRRLVRVAFIDPGKIGAATDSSSRAGCYIVRA